MIDNWPIDGQRRENNAYVLTSNYHRSGCAPRCFLVAIILRNGHDKIIRGCANGAIPTSLSACLLVQASYAVRDNSLYSVVLDVNGSVFLYGSTVPSRLARATGNRPEDVISSDFSSDATRLKPSAIAENNEIILTRFFSTVRYLEQISFHSDIHNSARDNARVTSVNWNCPTLRDNEIILADNY
jgi:hypothetical protein